MLLKLFMSQAKSLHYARPKTLHNHIGLQQELPTYFQVIRVFEVECDAALVSIH